jgi:hypothetical protein
MTAPVDTILTEVAEELHTSKDELIREGLQSFLERELRRVQAEIFDITSRYNISGVEEMEAKYQDGTLEETDSWRDLQRLDHLEYKRDRFQRLLKMLS